MNTNQLGIRETTKIVIPSHKIYSNQKPTKQHTRQKLLYKPYLFISTMGACLVLDVMDDVDHSYTTTHRHHGMHDHHHHHHGPQFHRSSGIMNSHPFGHHNHHHHSWNSSPFSSRSFFSRNSFFSSRRSSFF